MLDCPHYLGHDAVLRPVLKTLEKQLAVVMGYLVDALHYDIVLYIADPVQAGKTRQNATATVISMERSEGGINLT